MAIDFDVLFANLGKVLKWQYDIDTYAATAATDAANIISTYGDSNEAVYDGIQNALTGAQSSGQGTSSYLSQLAAATINAAVYADNPLLSSSNTTLSLQEIVRQMVDQSESVLAYTVGSSVSATEVTSGNGTVAVSSVGKDGLNLQEVFVENVRLAVSQDSTSGSSFSGNEVFQASGQQSQGNALAADWPKGSGCRVNLTAINATKDNSGGNLLTNSDFESFTSNTPSSWTVITGVAGSQILQSTGQHYTGASSLEYVGNSSTQTEIRQAVTTLKSETVYQFAVWLKVDVVPAAGVLAVRLVDGSGTVINDDAGTANSVAVTLSGVTTSWVAHTGTFRMPYVLPSTVKIGLKLTTALSTGSNLFLDQLGFGTATQLYTGGPFVSVFSGSSSYYAPDFYTLALSNNRLSNKKSFQVGLDRLLNLRQLGLQLPYAGSPSQSDDLIA